MSADIHDFLEGLESGASEEVTGFGGMPVPKKASWSGSTEPSSIHKLVDRFPAPSIDPDRRRKIVLSVPADSRIFSSL